MIQMMTEDLMRMKEVRQNQDLDPGHAFEAHCSFCYSLLLFLHILGGTRLPLRPLTGTSGI